jgi:hypothetical protein
VGDRPPPPDDCRDCPCCQLFPGPVSWTLWRPYANLAADISSQQQSTTSSKAHQRRGFSFSKSRIYVSSFTSSVGPEA